MSTANAIRRALPILAEHGRGDAGILRVWLIRSGVSRVDAAAAIRFVPLALGRAILLAGLGITFSDSLFELARAPRLRPNAGTASRDGPAVRRLHRRAQQLEPRWSMPTEYLANYRVEPR